MRKDLENCIKKEHKNAEILLTEIGFFQHERFIHLVVTFMTGISAILFLGFFLLTDNIGMFLLFLLTFALFLPYIFHYYYLENGVQKLYDIYRNLKEKDLR